MDELIAQIIARIQEFTVFPYPTEVVIKQIGNGAGRTVPDESDPGGEDDRIDNVFFGFLTVGVLGLPQVLHVHSEYLGISLLLGSFAHHFFADP